MPAQQDGSEDDAAGGLHWTRPPASSAMKAAASFANLSAWEASSPLAASVSSRVWMKGFMSSKYTRAVILSIRLDHITMEYRACADVPG